MMARLRCWFGFHDDVLTDGDCALALRCVSCGRLTNGWQWKKEQ